MICNSALHVSAEIRDWSFRGADVWNLQHQCYLLVLPCWLISLHIWPGLHLNIALCSHFSLFITLKKSLRAKTSPKWGCTAKAPTKAGKSFRNLLKLVHVKISIHLPHLENWLHWQLSENWCKTHKHLTIYQKMMTLLRCKKRRNISFFIYELEMKAI